MNKIRMHSKTIALAFVSLMYSACVWDPGRLFDRPDPAVERARKALDLSAQGADADLSKARRELEDIVRFYCRSSDAGSDLVLERHNASFDLGLVLFRISELFGRRFGEEEAMAETEQGQENEGLKQVMEARGRELECTQLLLGAIANDASTPRSLALRARYLLGNFAFLSRRYQLAVEHYDKVLLEHPAQGTDPMGEVGPPNDDDAVARNSAWNRAIALKRINDQKPDASNDSSSPDANTPPDSSNDGSSDSKNNDGASDGSNGNDGSSDSNQDSGSGGNDGSSGPNDSSSNQKPDTGNGNSNENDASSPPPPPSSSSGTPPPQPPPPSKVDLRELDRFDQKAPLELDPKWKQRRRIPKAMDK